MSGVWVYDPSVGDMVYKEGEKEAPSGPTFLEQLQSHMGEGKDVATIDGVTYRPFADYAEWYASPEQGESVLGPVQYIYRYTSDNPGSKYDLLDPVTGKVIDSGVFKEKSHGFFGDIWYGVKTGARELGPILKYTPVGPYVQAINAIADLEEGKNIAGSIAQLADIGGYSDVAKAAKLASAIENKDPFAAASYGMELGGVKDIGGFTAKDIRAADRFVRGAQNVIKGDIDTASVGNILEGARNFTDNPNVALATKALSVVQAGGKFDINNPASAVSFAKAVENFNNELGRYQTATLDTGDETERLLKRYPKPDPLRSADYVTQLGNAGLQETPFTLQDLTENLPSVEAGEPQPTGTQMPPQELARFLETNVQDPAELDALMREYYPDMYRGESGETQVIPVVGKKIYPDEEPDRTPGSPWDTSPRGGTTGREDEVIAPTPEPTPAPTQAPTQAPTRAPTRAPAFVGQQTQAPQYAVLDAILAGKMGDPFDPYLLGRPPQDEELQKLLSVLGLNQQG